MAIIDGFHPSDQSSILCTRTKQCFLSLMVEPLFYMEKAIVQFYQEVPISIGFTNKNYFENKLK